VEKIGKLGGFLSLQDALERKKIKNGKKNLLKMFQ
jgi:hypothetical protein